MMERGRRGLGRPEAPVGAGKKRSICCATGRCFVGTDLDQNLSMRRLKKKYERKERGGEEADMWTHISCQIK